MKVILITGMLASGKSIALRVFQDLGYYCIDNLPPTLIIPFMEQIGTEYPDIDKIGIITDARSEAFFGEIDHALAYLRDHSDLEICFVDASDEVLIQRYKLMRRKHIMNKDERIEDTIKRERTTLEPLRRIADYLLDTSFTKDAEFKAKLMDIFATDQESKRFLINVVSFGFKYGILKDADLIFDVRFLPNPYYDPELKVLTGMDHQVQDYVMSFEESKEFADKTIDLIRFLIPYYKREGKSQLIIGVGCSGGRHRSVTIAKYFSERLCFDDCVIATEHRDLYKDDYIRG